MAALYEVEVEPEVRVWLDSLSDRDFGRVDFLVGVLAEHAETLGALHPPAGRQGPRVEIRPAALADPA